MVLHYKHSGKTFTQPPPPARLPQLLSWHPKKSKVIVIRELQEEEGEKGEIGEDRHRRRRQDRRHQHRRLLRLLGHDSPHSLFLSFFLGSAPSFPASGQR